MTAEKQGVADLVRGLRMLDGRRAELETRAAAAEKRAQEARTAIADASGPAIDRLLAEAGRAEAEASTLRAAIAALAKRRSELEAELRAALAAQFEDEARKRLEEAREVEDRAAPLLHKLADALGCADLPAAVLGRLPATARPARLKREAELLRVWTGDVHLPWRWEPLLEAILAGTDPVAAALRL